MSTIVHAPPGALPHGEPAHDAHHEHHGMPHGWRRWLFATNHKDIGTMCLLSRSRT